MIKKRYLMILSVAVVSVLFGSLLYMNLVLAGKPEPQPSTTKDSVKIDVLGWATRQYTSGQGSSREYGIAVSGDYSADLGFVFQPSNSNFNITEIYVVLYATGSVDAFSLTINDAGIYVSQMYLTLDVVTARRYQLDPNAVQINEGMNLLSMSANNSFLSVYEIEVFIEYEYQAR